MTKIDPIDIDAIHTYANVIQKQHKEMLEARKSYVIEMYKILRKNNYTRTGAINSIHSLLCDILNSMIEVRKGFIEDATKELK